MSQFRRPQFESLESRQLMAVDATLFLELPYAELGYAERPAADIRLLPRMHADQGGLALEWRKQGKGWPLSIWSDTTPEGTRRRTAMPESDPENGIRNRKITRERMGAPHPEAARTVYYRTHSDPFREEWVAWDKDDGWYVLVEGTSSVVRVRDEFWYRKKIPAGRTGLYVTDGDPGSEPTLVSSNVNELEFTLATTTMTEVGDRIFALDSDSVSRLFVTDRTRDGTKEIFRFTTPFTVTPTMTRLGSNRIVFRGDIAGGTTANLFVSDGTPEGTRPVMGENVGELDGLSPSNFASVGEYAIFSAGVTDEHGVELWRTDGTREGTYLLVDANPGSASSIFPGSVRSRHATYTDGEIAYVVYDYLPRDQPELLTVTDGTREGTRSFSLPEGISIDKEFPHQRAYLTQVLDGRYYFRATGGIWTSDGTPEGTFLLSELVAEDAECHGIVAKKLICTSLGETAVNYWAVELRQQGDVNLDGQVTFADFLVLSANFAKDEAAIGDGDLNDDGTVGFADFLILSANFGRELFGD